ncbi:WD40-repeat-containing domain protein [Phlyctochytrium arcticum]|nr:WD40-repeat-containing domain protein [Phlyctochytrium arcticum]
MADGYEDPEQPTLIDDLQHNGISDPPSEPLAAKTLSEALPSYGDFLHTSTEDDLPPISFQEPTYQYDYEFAKDSIQVASTQRSLCHRLTNPRSGKGNINFVKFGKWSPDGTCLLSSTNEDKLLIFEKPASVTDFTTIHTEPLKPVLSIQEPEAVYDLAWYPHMSSADPATCCFLSSVRDHPVRMWDAYTGQIRCSYTANDHLEQVIAPTALTFNLDGSSIYCGFENHIQIFSVDRPGNTGKRVQITPTKKSRKGQKGLVSAIAFNPDRSGMYALGTFARSVGLYDELNNDLLHLLHLTDGAGITQTQFTPDGRKLLVASRKSDAIKVWDIRNTGEVVARLERKGDTNQRIWFDIDGTGKWCSTGDESGKVKIFNLDTFEIVYDFQAHKDITSSISWHPTLPLLATTSGQRRQLMSATVSTDGDGCITSMNDEDGISTPVDSQVALWGVPYKWPWDEQSCDPPMEMDTTK